MAVAALMIAGALRQQTPLWPGARFTRAEQNRAQRRGLLFLYSTARQPDIFHEWGHDLLSAFSNIAATNGDRELADMAQRMGHERALEWRRLNSRVPADADATTIENLVYGSDAATDLGVPDVSFHEALSRAAVRFSVTDYLGFDPRRQPPPAQNRYDDFQDALIDGYTFDHYHVPLGAHYADIVRWFPTMHPYPTRAGGWKAYYQGVFTITHLVYTYNRYNQRRVAPSCFPEEFTYLNSNLDQAIADNDPETLGEYLDTLQAFGLTRADPRIRRAVEYLLSVQNADGSWGNPKGDDVYTRYHSTWTALGGIQEFRPRPELGCPGR